MNIDFKDKVVYISSSSSTFEQDVEGKGYDTCCIASALIFQVGGYPFSSAIHNIPVMMKLPIVIDDSKQRNKFIDLCDVMIVLMSEKWKEDKRVNYDISLAHKLSKPVYLVHIAETTIEKQPFIYQVVEKLEYELCQNCDTYKSEEEMEQESDGYCKKCC